MTDNLRLGSDSGRGSISAVTSPAAFKWFPLLAVGWIAVAIAVSIAFRKKRGKPIFTKAPVDASFLCTRLLWLFPRYALSKDRRRTELFAFGAHNAKARHHPNLLVQFDILAQDIAFFGIACREGCAAVAFDQLLKVHAGQGEGGASSPFISHGAM